MKRGVADAVDRLPSHMNAVLCEGVEDVGNAVALFGLWGSLRLVAHSHHSEMTTV